MLSAPYSPFIFLLHQVEGTGRTLEEEGELTPGSEEYLLLAVSLRAEHKEPPSGQYPGPQRAGFQGNSPVQYPSSTNLPTIHWPPTSFPMTSRFKPRQGNGDSSCIGSFFRNSISALELEVLLCISCFSVLHSSEFLFSAWWVIHYIVNICLN